MQKNFLKAIGAHEPSMRMPEEPKGKEKISSGNPELDEAREKYPNMGKPWPKDDDVLLTEMFNEQKPNKEIAKHFGRKTCPPSLRVSHISVLSKIRGRDITRNMSDTVTLRVNG